MVSVDLRAILAAHRVLAIVRGSDRDACLRSLETLGAAGVRLAEVSLSGTGALGVITRAVERLGEVMYLGAGTVVTADDARAAADAGAQFVVSPCLSEGGKTAGALGLAALLGAFTPTEINDAWRRGPSAVKVFPASVGGPAYLKALHDPFPDIPLVAVGGVRAADVTVWLEAGALAVGLGADLLGDAPHGGDQGALASRARRLVEALQP